MWCFLLQNVYGIVSIGMYFIIARLIIRERKYFCSTFIKLILTLSAVNICTFTTIYILVRIPREVTPGTAVASFLENFPWPFLLRFGMFLGFYLCMCQHLSLFFIIFHRMRAITWPFDREAIWDTHYWITLLVICLGPIGFIYSLLFIDYHFIYKSGYEGYVLEAIDLKQKSNLMQMTVFSWVITILGVFTNAVAIFMLCKRSMSSNYRRELNLFLISFLGFVVQSVQAAVCVGFYISTSESQLWSFCQSILPLTNDLFSLGFPYFFLVFNARIRKCFFELPLFMAFRRMHLRHKCDKSCQHLAPSDAEASVVYV